MEKEREPTRNERLRPEEAFELDSPLIDDGNQYAVRFLLDSVNATIYASGDDYLGALGEFFPQIQALGHLVGARDLDEVSAFLRDRGHW